jgi:hypothetical protein
MDRAHAVRMTGLHKTLDRSQKAVELAKTKYQGKVEEVKRLEAMWKRQRSGGSSVAPAVVKAEPGSRVRAQTTRQPVPAAAPVPSRVKAESKEALRVKGYPHPQPQPQPLSPQPRLQPTLLKPRSPGGGAGGGGGGVDDGVGGGYDSEDDAPRPSKRYGFS